MQQTIQINELEQKRKDLLDFYKTKQSFRVSVGKSKWVEYREFCPAYNLREVLNNEVAIEFDMPKDWSLGLEAFQDVSWAAINFTAINLLESGYEFEVWDHGGKSPHLHIHNLPISHLEKDKRKLFKKIFIRKYVPKEYLQWVDISLTGVHLIAIEWAEHWKGKYGIKKLINKWGDSE